MTMYAWIRAMDEPKDGLIDEQDRSIVFFNVIAQKAPSDTFLRELIHLISGEVAAGIGVGVFGSDLLSSGKVDLPEAGDVTVIVETGGPPPEQTHNVLGVAYQRSTAAIRVHSAKFETANMLARRAYNILTKVRNQDVSAA